MAISGFTPATALPTLVPGGTMLAGSNPLLAAQAGSVPSGAALAAQAGVGEQPGIGSRFLSAMRAAISELRGRGASDEQIRTQMLAMHAQPPARVGRPAPARTPRPRGAKPAADGKPRRAGAARPGAAAQRPATVRPRPATVAPAQAQQPIGVAQPANAIQLPGATAYSYDGNGNPIIAPTMQQLGMTPTMLQGLTGMAHAADPDGPQVNATNQTNLSGVGSGLGLGAGVPVLGQPIVTTAPTPAVAAGPPTTPHNGTGGTQSVTNRNTTDVANRNQGFGGWGGYGSPWDPSGGIATPYSPYGASMTGAYALGGERRGFLGRLFG